MQKKITLVECPRDAMQGWSHFIPTETKINYLNNLLQVGFDVLDCGSFVNPKAIPQMADTKIVLEQLDLKNSKTKLLTIVANERGAQDAIAFPQITYVGFPFSISETFQHLNTNSSIAQSLERVAIIQKLCVAHNKKLVVYISMGFGNPYGDAYNPEIVQHWIGTLSALGIQHFSLADTVGMANVENIAYLFSTLIPVFPALEIGAHFHTTAETWKEKIDAAYTNGCTKFDGAINGIGGCPMAQDVLVGNMDMLNLVKYFDKDIEIDLSKLETCAKQATSIFL